MYASIWKKNILSSKMKEKKENMLRWASIFSSGIMDGWINFGIRLLEGWLVEFYLHKEVHSFFSFFEKSLGTAIQVQLGIWGIWGNSNPIRFFFLFSNKNIKNYPFRRLRKFYLCKINKYIYIFIKKKKIWWHKLKKKWVFTLLKLINLKSKWCVGYFLSK